MTETILSQTDSKTAASKKAHGLSVCIIAEYQTWDTNTSIQMDCTIFILSFKHTVHMYIHRLLSPYCTSINTCMAKQIRDVRMQYTGLVRHSTSVPVQSVALTSQQLWYHCLNSKETTQLWRKTTWEKGPTTEPWTRDLRSNAEFQPSKRQNRPRSFVRHRRYVPVTGVPNPRPLKTRDFKVGTCTLNGSRSASLRWMV